MTTPYPEPGRPTGPPAGPPPSFVKPPAAQVPPGWYPGPAGVPQWWDGYGWGPTAPPPQDNSTTMALLAYLGTFIGGFVVPLIVLMTEGRRNRFVKHHATEVLNWTITTAMVSLVLVVLYIVGLLIAFAGSATTRNVGAGAGGFAVVLVLFVAVLIALSVSSLVFVIMGAVQAGKRRYWRFPVAVRFVKGAASKEEVEALNRGVG